MESREKSEGLNRRDFMAQGAAAFFVAGAARAFSAGADDPVSLPKLDYGLGGLAPYLSEKTLAAHYGKHHAGYMETARDLMKGTRFEGMGLRELLAATAPSPNTDAWLYDSNYSLYRNAVLAVSHNFYWKSLKPKGGGIPHASFEKVLINSFGSYDAFRDRFVGFSKSGVHGWIWLVRSGKDKIAFRRTDYGANPFTFTDKPLACIDLWEHAFYLDYQNRFADYLTACVDHLLNWDFIKAGFEAV